MTPVAGVGLAAVGMLVAVEGREARTRVAAVAASRGRGAVLRAAVLPGLGLVALAGGATGVVVLPRGWAQLVGPVVLLTAGLQWLVWAARRESGVVAGRDEGVVFEGVRLRMGAGGGGVGQTSPTHPTSPTLPTSLAHTPVRTSLRTPAPASARTETAGALLRAGAEVLVVTTAVAAAAVPRAWLPASALLFVVAVIAPGAIRHRPAGGLPERPAKAAVAVLLTAAGATAVTAGAVGVLPALLLPMAGLFVLALTRRKAPPAPVPDGDAPATRLRALRQFVLGDDLAVWCAVAVLVVAVRLPVAAFHRAFHRGPAAELLLTVLLLAVLSGTARRARTSTTP
ncbi:hypothetical protein OG588_22190 [Streptomyces prunicolor]|uniref:hypothetical protein n=1 Tax=Streptomyces prunicolor TaxID=67348 RepID=UPI003870B18E|nr:hypothetical protein OG588_22190 [Streptomyces prunicolor]